MTNNEAIQHLEFDRAMMLFDPATGEVITPEILKALSKEKYLTYVADEVAIKALKEIQLYKDNKLCLVPEDVYSRQCSELDGYKEIGTVEECKDAMNLWKRLKEAGNNLYKVLAKCSEYERIGTVKECREAVEKQKAKKPVEDKYHHNCCPNCGWIVSGESGYGEEFCPHCENCGQAISWEESEEE